MNSRFHHRGISRLTAENLLTAKGKEGSFLVRDSETVQGAYTLCLLNKNNIMKQYRILPDEAGMLRIQAVSGVEERRFQNISALIEHYMSRGENNGLECALRNPVQSQQVQDDKDSDEEEDYECTERPLTSLEGSFVPAVAANSQLPLAAAPQPVVPAGLAASRKSGTVAEYFQERLKLIDLTQLDSGFVSQLREYAEHGALDDARHVIGKKLDRATKLDRLLADSFRDVEKALDAYMVKMDLTRELFAPLKTPKLSASLTSRSQAEGLQQSMDSTVEKIKQLKTSVINLQQKAVSQFKKLQEEELAKSDDIPPRPAKPPRVRQEIPQMHFKILVKKKNGTNREKNKVRQLKHALAASSVMLTVDVTQGKVLGAKTSGQKFNDVFTHDKVLQLVKNTKNNKVLDLHIVGQKHQTYEFESVRYRESFCQLVNQMKIQHSSQEELESMTVFVGTWNVADCSFPEASELANWLTCQGTGKSRDRSLRHVVFDMYVLGFQELPLREEKLVKKIQEVFVALGLENEVQMIAVKILWSIGIIVFIKTQHKNKVFYLETASEATGIANTLGNKGAVGVSFNVNGTSFCFVCAHLAARQDASRNERRNQNYRDIIKGMRNLGPKKLNNVVDLTNRFHHIFFLGDLNYRIDDTNTEVVLKNIEKGEYQLLQKKDQLKTTQKDGKAFVEFREEEITFPPTYRIKKGSVNEYVVEKVKKSGIRYNTPSWCDRVLWKSYPNLYLRNSSYGSVEEIRVSDHKPVFSSFDLGITPNSISIPSCNITSCKGPQTVIVFDEVSASVKMNNRELLTLEFHSSILENFKSSKKNKKFGDLQGCTPRWTANDFEKLKPIIGDVEYLEQQHVILVVKSEDNMESYGEAVVSLRDKCSADPSRFKCTLTHHGEETGTISGKLHMEGLPNQNKGKATQRRGYELIWLDTEVYGDAGTRFPEISPPQVSAAMGTDEALYSEPIGDRERKHLASAQVLGTADPELLYYEEVPTAAAAGSNDSQQQLQATSKNQASAGSKSSKGESAGKEKANPNQEPKVGQLDTKQKRGGAKSDHSYQNVHLPPRLKPLTVDSSTENSSKTGTKPKPQPRATKTEAQSNPVDDVPPPKPCAGMVKNTIAQFAKNTESNTNEVGVNKRAEPAASNQSKGSNVGFKKGDHWPFSIKGKPEENPVYECEGTVTSARDLSTNQPPRVEVSEELYEVLENPATVESWLRGLDLSQYAKGFLEYGFDQLKFVLDFTTSDLFDLGVRDENHQVRILQSIQNMRRSLKQ